VTHAPGDLVDTIPPRDRLALVQRLVTVVLAPLTAGLTVTGAGWWLPAAFVPLAVIHGLRRYGWRPLSAYAAVTVVVSLGLENLSVATGFPFGHFHQIAGGPYVGKVPFLAGVLSFSLGYVCWITASALLDGADQRLGDRTAPARRIELVALPALAAVLMVLGSDSIESTVNHTWIWEQGGGVVGVPWTRYAGWWFVTFLFFGAFALFLARPRRTVRRPGAVGREPLLQAVVLDLLLGLGSIPALVLALLALTRLARNDPDRYETTAQFMSSLRVVARTAPRARRSG
jgi:uncharacterized membrane protein